MSVGPVARAAPFGAQMAAFTTVNDLRTQPSASDIDHDPSMYESLLIHESPCKRDDSSSLNRQTRTDNAPICKVLRRLNNAAILTTDS